MKKITSACCVLAFLATITFVFSSCQQKNQSNEPVSEIVGNWEVMTMDFISDTGHGTTSTETYPGQGMRIIFKKDNLCTLYDGGGIQQGTFSLSGKNITVVINEPFNSVIRYVIQELNTSTLVLKSIEEGGNATVYHCSRS